MTVLKGKWYIAIRTGDLCFGIGRPPAALAAQALASRPRWPKRWFPDDVDDGEEDSW